MNKLIDIFQEERICEYRGEVYSVRDNGAILRHPKNKPRILDNKWTFGKINIQKGYPMISNEAIHRIVATAFLGEAPTKSHVVDHIDTNRQNNRPNNLRWVTRLENIILNDITRKKIELLCECDIEIVLSDLSILRSKKLPPQYEWMKVVSQEEAANSLASWKKWVQKIELNKKNDDETMSLFNERKDNRKMNYVLEPKGHNLKLEDYYNNLKEGKIFCYKDYSHGRVTYEIIEFVLNKDTNILSVATTTDDEHAIKSLFITSICLENNHFNYETRSFFSPDGVTKYMTLAKGEEWTGGEVFDDYC